MRPAQRSGRRNIGLHHLRPPEVAAQEEIEADIVAVGVAQLTHLGRFLLAPPLTQAKVLVTDATRSYSTVPAPSFVLGPFSIVRTVRTI